MGLLFKEGWGRGTLRSSFHPTEGTHPMLEIKRFGKGDPVVEPPNATPTRTSRGRGSNRQVGMDRWPDESEHAGWSDCDIERAKRKEGWARVKASRRGSREGRS